MAGRRPETCNGEPVPYDEPVESLRALARTPGPKAWAAIRALGEHPGPEALAILIELTRSPDPHLRRSAVEAIGGHLSGRDAADRVLEMLQDREGFVVRSACDAAAVLGLPATHDRIKALIEAEEEGTRYAALEALESLWEPSDFEEVFAQYRHDACDRVRKRAAWTLAARVGPEHWERAFEAWSRDPLPRHRAWACSLIEKFGDRSSLMRLDALRSDSDGHVRGAARRAACALDES